MKRYLKRKDKAESLLRIVKSFFMLQELDDRCHRDRSIKKLYEDVLTMTIEQLREFLPLLSLKLTVPYIGMMLMYVHKDGLNQVESWKKIKMYIDVRTKWEVEYWVNNKAIEPNIDNILNTIRNSIAHPNNLEYAEGIAGVIFRCKRGNEYYIQFSSNGFLRFLEDLLTAIREYIRGLLRDQIKFGD